MTIIEIRDGNDKVQMQIAFEKDATVLEAMDALVNLKKKELNGTSTGYREASL